MPIIVSTVPFSAEEKSCQQIRSVIRASLEAESGISPCEVTVEFIPCLYPERLVVKYQSRSEYLLKNNQANTEAWIVGKIIQAFFKLPVECLVSFLEKEKTGIYLT